MFLVWSPVSVPARSLLPVWSPVSVLCDGGSSVSSGEVVILVTVVVLVVGGELYNSIFIWSVHDLKWLVPTGCL